MAVISLYRLSNDIPAEGGCIRIAYNIIPEHLTAGNHHTIQLMLQCSDNCFYLWKLRHIITYFASYQVLPIFASAISGTRSFIACCMPSSTMVLICSSSSSQTSKINSS